MESQQFVFEQFKAPLVKSVYQAHLIIQRQIKNPVLDGFNPYHKSQFATLKQVLGLVKNAMNQCDCIFQQEFLLKGQGQPGFVTTVFHVPSETQMSTVIAAPAIPDEAQRAMGLLTYLRRYGLLNHFGIIGDIDDDGNSPEAKAESDPQGLREKFQRLMPKLVAKFGQEKAEEWVEGMKVSTSNNYAEVIEAMAEVLGEPSPFKKILERTQANPPHQEGGE